jgi:hypothetical protein
MCINICTSGLLGSTSGLTYLPSGPSVLMLIHMADQRHMGHMSHDNPWAWAPTSHHTNFVAHTLILNDMIGWKQLGKTGPVLILKKPVKGRVPGTGDKVLGWAEPNLDC